jgi:hypothetical protein
MLAVVVIELVHKELLKILPIYLSTTNDLHRVITFSGTMPHLVHSEEISLFDEFLHLILIDIFVHPPPINKIIANQK